MKLSAKRILAPALALAVAASVTGVALAQDDILTQLNQLSQQDAAPMQLDSATTGLADEVLVPDEAEVEMDVADQAGATEEEQLQGYIAREEAAVAANQSDASELARLGIAYRMASRNEKARAALEKALAQAPGAQSLYDELAKALSGLEPGIKVYVDGKIVTFDVQPTIVNSRTLVPIRKVVEQLGGSLGWDPATSTATVNLGPNTVEITKDSSTATVNGQTVTLQVPATIMNGRFLLPLRFVAENLNQDVQWHPGTGGAAVISVIEK